MGNQEQLQEQFQERRIGHCIHEKMEHISLLLNLNARFIPLHSVDCGWSISVQNIAASQKVSKLLNIYSLSPFLSACKDLHHFSSVCCQTVDKTEKSSKILGNFYLTSCQL